MWQKQTDEWESPSKALRRGPYHGPERRRYADRHLGLLTGVLDEVDYGLVLLDAELQVLHLNHAALAELHDAHPLRLVQDHLVTRSPQDSAPFRDALQDATQSQRRRMLVLGHGLSEVRLSIIPLPRQDRLPNPVLVVVGKTRLVSPLAVQAFARASGLSPVEEQVLTALCQGVSPREIADKHGVKIATIRTQIASIRVKTGAVNIRDLVQQVACLPPMVETHQRLRAPRMGAV